MAGTDPNRLSDHELEVAQRTGTLSLANRKLTALPPEIFQLTSLQELDLTNRRLGALPPEIGQLTHLQKLSLAGNRLAALPPEIGQLTSLRKLDLTGNQLGALPPEIGKFTHLQKLSLTGNQLAALPPEIGQLTSLRELSLDGNRLTTLPPEIGQLTSLQKLDLTSNQLGALPPEIVKLTRLLELRLGHNRLTRLPPEIGQLTQLQKLYLTANRLTTLPPEIGQLTQLLTLSLVNTRMTALPAEIGQLTRLWTLGLSRNQLTALPLPLFKLTNLRRLFLDDNQLTALPQETFQLRNLRELSLNRNQLGAVPPEIGKLTHLQELSLKGNQLTTLPPQLAKRLRAGLSIELQGNPLREPFPELMQRGSEALAAYLRSLDDAVPQFEAKVLLVGEGNVGKTSLIAALANAPFIEGRPTTHGIEIQPLALRHPDLDADMTLRAWDFGGQEVYRITHQFFFSRRALYLVVWNAREGQEQNEVEGWLRRIRLRVSRDARGLVVATHRDERRPELDYPHLEQAFPELLTGWYEVDNRTGRGIAELREGIAAEAARLPQMGQLISSRWIAARDEILDLANTEPQIPYGQFVAICQAHHVNGDEVITLAELMHDLGQIVYYGDDESLRDFVVLNPEWLTKAISYVLEDEPTREVGGILDHAHLAQIWQDRPGGPAYPTRYHPYFLRLMEKFDISYRLEDDPHRSLVAQLVPHRRPALPWDTRTPPSSRIRRLILVCQLSEPAPGLVAWLTVRHHRASTEQYWRSGVFLRHPIAAYASEALIELRAPDQLVVDVRAPSPDFFFNVLRDSIEDLITRRWPGLTYQLLIPCPTINADGSACSSLISMTGLLGYREEGETNYRCMNCMTRHDLSVLLTGFAHPDLPLQLELEQLHDEIVEVGGGVKHLEGAVDRLEGYAAETADSMRRVLRAVSNEITDCPLLFSITEQTPAGAQRLRFDQRHYQLILWCEHPGHWHPWPAASYSLGQPRRWLVRIGPYATLILKALKLAMPLAGPVADMMLTDQQLTRAQHQLDLMTAVVAELSVPAVQDRDQLVTRESASQLTPAEGQSARALRTLLFEYDPTRAFGDLRRVQAPSGDFLWVCTDHYPEYDPGLPAIPVPAT
jgi:internalin A